MKPKNMKCIPGNKRRNRRFNHRRRWVEAQPLCNGIESRRGNHRGCYRRKHGCRKQRTRRRRDSLNGETKLKRGRDDDVEEGAELEDGWIDLRQREKTQRREKVLRETKRRLISC